MVLPFQLTSFYGLTPKGTSPPQLGPFRVFRSDLTTVRRRCWLISRHASNSRFRKKTEQIAIPDSRAPTTHDSRLTTHDSRLTTHDSRLTTHDSRLTTHSPIHRFSAYSALWIF